MSRDDPADPTDPTDPAAWQDSPCIGVCEIDLPSGFCRGCGRKAQEIAAWRTLDSQQRQEILEQLPARLPLTRKRRGGRRRTQAQAAS